MTCYLQIDDALRRPRDRSPSPTPSPKRRSFDKLERCWFQAALRCDFEQLKKYYSKDRFLIDKKDNFTALIHWVTKKDRLDILNWVVQNKGDISARTGYTALHLASMHGHENIIRKLIDEYGANTECRDYSGRKPSYYLENNMSTISPNVISPIARPVDATDNSNTPTPSPKHNHSMNSHDESFRRKSKIRRNLSISHSFKKGKKLVEKHLESSSMVQRNKSVSPFDNERNSEQRKSIKIEHPHLKDDSIDQNNNSDRKSQNSDNIYTKLSQEQKSDIDLNKAPTEESQWTVWV